MNGWLFIIVAWLCTLCASIGLMVVAHAQNTVQIYQFNPATLPLTGQELVPLSQNGNTVQTTISVLGTAPFTSIAAVEAAAIPAGAVVCRNGYTMGGDSPEVCYTASNTNCTLNGGAGDGGAQLPRYGGGCLNILPYFQYWVDIWGADRTGVNSSTMAVQNASNYLCSLPNPGGRLAWLNGTYRQENILFQCPIYAHGQGESATTVFSNAANINYGFFWDLPGFPNTKYAIYMNGGGIEGMTLNYEDTQFVSTGYALEAFGIRSFLARDIKLWYCTANCNTPTSTTIPSLYSTPGLLQTYGVEGADLRNLQILGVGGNRNGFYFYGDIAGQDISGAACTTSTTSCSSRSDFFVMNDIDTNSGGTCSTGNPCNGMYIHGFVNDVMGEHFAFEGYNHGLVIDCQSGVNSNLSQCPQFQTLKDWQNEFGFGTSVLAADFLGGLVFDQPYCWTNGGTYCFEFAAGNYGTTAHGPVAITNAATLGSSNSDAIHQDTGVVIGEYTIANNIIFGYGVTASASAAFNCVSGGTLIHLNFANNMVGQRNNFPASVGNQAYGLNLGCMADVVNEPGNIYQNVGQRINLTGSTNYPITGDTTSVGPGGGPTLGTCGTSPSLATGASDTGFQVTIGTGTVTSCQINLANQYWRAPVCSQTEVSGSSVVTTSLVTTKSGGPSSVSTVTLESGVSNMASNSYYVTCQW